MESKLASQISVDLAMLNAKASSLAADAMQAVNPNIEPRTSAESFAQVMKNTLHAVDEKERIATNLMADVDSGRSDNLVGAMLASQEASLSFSMLMQVRNKVMGAVDDLIKLPL